MRGRLQCHMCLTLNLQRKRNWSCPRRFWNGKIGILASFHTKFPRELTKFSRNLEASFNRVNLFCIFDIYAKFYKIEITNICIN